MTLKSYHMKKNKTKKITKIMLPIICGIGLIVYCVISKNKELMFKLLISLLLIAVFIGIVFGILYLLILRHKIIETKIQKYYQKLKQKSHKNIFENLFVLSYEKKCDELIKRSLHKYNIKGISNVNVQLISINKIFMSSNYKGFVIAILVEPESIQYLIDSPTRYNGIKANEEFEKIKKEKMSNFYFSNVNDFAAHIAKKIDDLKEKIEIFSITNIVDPIFNGRLLEKLSKFLSQLRKEGLVCIIFTPPLIVFMGFGLIYSYIDTNYKVENPVGFYLVNILSSAFIILFIAFFIYGIKMLTRRASVKKDYKEKKLSVISETPTKVKIVKEKPGKHSDDLYLKYVILYFNKTKLIIPFAYTVINNRSNIKKCCERCTRIKTELKYLTYSKIIIDGEKQFRKIIKDYIL